MNNFLKKFFLVFAVFVILLAALGAINVFTTSVDSKNTYKNAYRWTGKPKDKLYDWAQEVEDRIDGTTANQSFLFDPTDTVPDACEGRLYYNATDNGLKLYTGSSWVDVDMAGAGSLDDGYDISEAITVDGTAVTLTTGTGDNNVVLAIVQNETDNNSDAVTITMGSGATGKALYIDGESSGTDIDADNWSISNAGALVCVGVDTTSTISLANNETIIGDTAHEIQFGDDGADYEDISFVFGSNNNIISLATDSGATTFDFGVIDDLTGVDDVTFDVGGTSNTITCAGSGAGKDLTIQQTVSAADASLILQSTGTGTDALSLISSVGDIKLNSADNIDIDAADNVTIDTADGSFTLTVGGGTDGDMTVAVADAITITSTDSAQNGIHIEANGGTSESINLYSNQGTGASATTEHDASIQLQSDAGGISLYTTGNVADAIRIEANGGTSETITVLSVKGTGTSSVDIDSTVGGITIQAHAAGKDVDIDSVLGSIYIEAEENDANAIMITSDGGTASGLLLHNDTGTSVTESHASIQLLSDVGGIALQSDANLANAISVMVDGGTASKIMIFNDTGTSVTEDGASIQIWSDVGGIDIQSDANLANSIVLRTDGGTADTMVLHADTGTSVTESAAAITLQADDGGISIVSDANLGKGIQIVADGGNLDSIFIQSDQGTSVTENSASIQLLSDDGGICIQSDANLAYSVVLRADGGNLETMFFHSDLGTAASAASESDASIQLLSDAGGIGLLSNLNGNDAIRIEANGGTSANIAILNNQGTDANSIEIISDDGGITITAGKPVVITNAFEPDIVLVPDASTYTVLANNSGQDHIFPDLTADCNVTMVAEVDGMHYRFIYVGGAADAEDWAFNTQDDTKFFIGGLVHHDEDGELTACVYSDGSDDSVLKVLTPMAGTVIEMWRDGTNWRITGTVISATNTAIVFVEQ